MRLNEQCRDAMLVFIESENAIEKQEKTSQLELKKVRKELIIDEMIRIGYTAEDSEYALQYLYTNGYIKVINGLIIFVEDITEKGHKLLRQLHDNK